MKKPALLRWCLYLAISLAAIPVVVWLAFGPGAQTPYAIYTWPADRFFSLRTPDVLRDTVVSAGVWFVACVMLDALVMRARRPSQW